MFLKVYIKNNNLTNSSIIVVGGMGNYVINNSLSGEKSNAMIKLLDTSSNHIISNNMTFSNLENVVIIKNSKDNEIAHNNMSGIADKVVYSIDSGYTNL